MFLRSIGFFFLFFQIITVCSQEDLTLKKKRAEANAFIEEGNYTSALKKALEIKSYTEKKYGALNPEHGTSLKDLAVAYYYLYDCANSALYIEQARDIFYSDPGSMSYLYAEVLQQKSYILLNCNEIEKAEDATFQSLTIIETFIQDSTLLLASLYSDLGYLQTTQGKILQAKKSYEKARQIMQQNSFTATYQYAYLINNIASLYHDLDDFTNAKKYYDESLVMHETLYGEHSFDYAQVLNNEGLLYVDFGNYEKGSENIFKASKIIKEMKGIQSMEYASSLNDIGNIYDKESDYQKAEQYYNQSLQIKKTIAGEGNASYWKTLNNLAILYSKLGNYPKAITMMESLIALQKKYNGDKQAEYGNYLNTLAYVYVENNDYANAENYFNQALVFSKNHYGESHSSYARVLNNLGYLYAQQNKPAKALEYYKRSVTIIEKDTTNKIDLADSYNNIGELYSEGKDYKNAAIEFQKALDIYQDVLGKKHPSYWITYSNIALLDYRSGNIPKAIQETKQVLDMNISMMYDYFAFLSESEKMKYWEKMHDQFEFFNSLSVKYYTQYPDLVNAMCDYSLATKSIVFNYTVQLKSKILSSGNQALIKQYNDWESKRQVLATYYNFTKKQLQDLNIDLVTLENEVLTLEKSIALQSADFKIAREVRKVTWKDVQSKLKDNEAAIQMIRIQTFNNTWTDSIVYAALILTKETLTRPVLIVLKNGNKLEKRYYKGFSNAVHFNQVTAEFYNVFWKDIDTCLGTKSIIYVSPDGVYNKISLQALKLPDGRYLFEKRMIQLMPILRTLASNKSTGSMLLNKAFLFGHPDYNYVLQNDSMAVEINTNAVNREVLQHNQAKELIGTKAEVENIETIMKDKGIGVTTYMGTHASETEIKKLQNPGNLHIATHGYFTKDYELNIKDTNTLDSKLKENPLLRSGLLLAGSNYALNHQSFSNATDDGILTAYEAMQLDLEKTELVILSACETGLGEEMNGEGVIGLQRAFMQAGADNMLMSLWKVNDEATQLLMTYFYKYLMLERNVGIAFNKAQKELYSTHQSPYYWAAFVYIKQ